MLLQQSEQRQKEDEERMQEMQEMQEDLFEKLAEKDIEFSEV